MKHYYRVPLTDLRTDLTTTLTLTQCEAALSGYSHLGVSPRPHLLGLGLDEALGRGHDTEMRQFGARLAAFVEQNCGLPGAELQGGKKIESTVDFGNLSSEE